MTTARSHCRAGLDRTQGSATGMATWESEHQFGMIEADGQGAGNTPTGLANAPCRIKETSAVPQFTRRATGVSTDRASRGGR